MKKWLGALACLLLLSACGQEAEQVFRLTTAEQDSYMDAIDGVMDEFYWEYDKGSLTFGGAIVPEQEGSERLFAASADSGYSLKGHQGEQAVLAEADLLHYNGDTAGRLQCYFSNGRLIGVLYRGGYDHGCYSLKERNPFLADGGFQQYEASVDQKPAFGEGNGQFSAEGYLSKGTGEQGEALTVAIEDGKAAVYRYRGGLSRTRNFSYGQGLEATSAVFLREDGARLAVLISSITEHGEGESEKTFSRSEKIMLYDDGLNPAGELPLESEFCTALGAEDGKLYLFINQNMDIYEETEAGWARTGSRKLRHMVTRFHMTDLDGDGQKEYLMSDGMDLYLYHRLGESFLLLWSTHLGVENFYGPLCSGDLNGDGVKEVYACDVTGTTIRYLLTEKGLQTANEDIDYGQCIYPCDFNADGREDYWLVQDNESRQGKLYLAEE